MLVALAIPDAPRAHVRLAAGARSAAGLAIPLALALCALAAYNEARFDDPFDLGYAQMRVDEDIAARIRAKGYFGLGHVPRNAVTALAWPPRLEHGWPEPDSTGMGILLTTPALLLCLRAGIRGTAVRGAWLALAALLVPILTYHNTGARQFGYRFLLDVIAPALVLLAAGLRGRVGWPLRLMVLAGVLVNAWGVAWWYGLGP
jgi:hypothetical protein